MLLLYTVLSRVYNLTVGALKFESVCDSKFLVITYCHLVAGGELV